MKKSKKFSWFVCLLGMGLLMAGLQLWGQSEVQALTMTNAARMTRGVLYSDTYGQLQWVYAAGGGSKILLNNPCHYINAVDSNYSKVVYSLRYNDSHWYIYSIDLDGRNNTNLASMKGKNVFVAYDEASKRVVYALPYNEQEKKGDFYSVSIYGGTSALLAQNAVMADIVGDRFVYQQEVANGDTNIYSIKLNGSLKANLATTGSDEIYGGKMGTMVIFTRLVSGQTDLYGIANSGSSSRRNGIPLAVNPNLNESFAGATWGRVIYYIEQLSEKDLWSVLPGGTNAKLLATGANFLLTYGNRVFYDTENVFSVNHDGTSTVQYGKNLGGRYMGFAGVLASRFIFTYGLEFGVGVYSSSVSNPDSDTITVRAPAYLVYFDVILSATSGRVVMANKNEIEIISKSVFGQYETKLGGKLPSDLQTKKKRYLFSTSSRHIYAIRMDDANNIWALYSDPLNGGTPVKLSESLSEENLQTVCSLSGPES
jgi:hypothetical protein